MVILLERADAVRVSGASAATVLRETGRGELIATARTPRGVYLYRREDVDEWARRRAARISAAERHTR